MDEVKKVWNKTAIQALLETNPKALIRALRVVYNNQTESEKNSHATTDDNGVGFTGVDAELLTSFADQARVRGTLSPKQMDLLKKKMPKYWKQILQEAERNGHTVCYKIPKKVAPRQLELA